MSGVTPQTPAQKPFGRSLADFTPLSPAETKLRDACKKGERAVIATELPKAQTTSNTLRADFIRFLALGGDDDTPVHEHGLQLHGAWLTGSLDLIFLTVPRPLLLFYCFIPEIYAGCAQIPQFSLTGTRVGGQFLADELSSSGSVFLNGGFQAAGTVTFTGANIAGDFNCTQGKFENTAGNAILADRINVSGNVFFSGGFEALGRVSMVDAVIGGNLICTQAKFDAGFNFQLVNVSGRFFFRQVAAVTAAELYDMQCAVLVDDAESWQGTAGKLALDGFTYGRFTGDDAPVDAPSRIKWLELQHPNHLKKDFKPQPWEQLIKVLRDMGHPNAAAAVAIAKQVRLRRSNRVRGLAKPFHWLYGALIGYGYKPARLVAIAVAVWFGCGIIYAEGNAAALFSPVKPAPGGPPPPTPASFLPVMYSLDALLPINFNYRNQWSVTTTDAAGNPLATGQWLQTLVWAETAFGWAASLLLVGVLGDLIKKD